MRILPLFARAYLLDTPAGPLLVDSGMPQESRKLLRLLGDVRPAALLLTHHHLDHAGGARLLWELYRLPIYAHPLDIPYLSGRQRRPAFLPIPWLGDYIANRIQPLPEEALRPVEEAEEVLGWRVVHLPGHTPGQIGLLRQGVLLAGDALRVGPRGPQPPPALVNHDTREARRTVEKIARLEVEAVFVGHGPPTTIGAVRTLAERLT
ncbi:MBL fold metallo-hydrolase [Meiothermus sp. QL-1]|uniref:MBL fold metallo-hydrolase n=1 Tax=Meiothermus sp. QL-1 TaxID=2058095 RepID=UPI000E0BEA97|nr:MBL fold metallo-hydrolase [Meiothermus sp. QL-1]RDI94560.1 MBL fold metallo-hydrolase [Meiothermus sp. QL-1]